MQKFSPVIPGFNGYSSIRNKNIATASSIQNFSVRDTSLRTRKGSATYIPASTSDVGSFFLFKTKAGVKHFLGSEGANLWEANSGLTAWNTPAVKTDCNNSAFCNATFMNKVYMGNGTDMLYYDGSTLSAMASAPKFTIIETHKNRLWSNDTDEPTYLYYTDFDTGGLPTALTKDNYIQISEDAGDPIKGITRLLTHLLVLNEFSAYAIYGSSIDDFTKIPVGPVGTVSEKTIANVNDQVMWLSQDGIYSYTGSSINPISFDLGRLEDVVNISRLQYACAMGYNGCYWLSIAGVGSTTNDMVLIYDTASRRWWVFKYPFNINGFCLDGTDLYCIASDKKIYKIESGTLDDGASITSNWVSDALDFGASGRLKKINDITIEMEEVTAGGIINLYIKEDNGSYSEAYVYDIPTSSPGCTVAKKVKTKKFYNLTIKLETTANVVIDKMSFSGKVKAKVG